jgi:uncharacterized membrane protein YhaH (DUF805 family)
MSEGRKGRHGWNWWYLLLLVQFVAVLCPPFYNRAEPAWIGMPFFYWYLLLWVIVGAVLTAVVDVATDGERRGKRRNSTRNTVQDVNWIALAIFVSLFVFITWLGFAAARWCKGDLDLLHEWGRHCHVAGEVAVPLAAR